MRLHHRFDGPEDAPVVVFANSLGTTLELWAPQVAAFTTEFRTLRYDQLGHAGVEGDFTRGPGGFYAHGPDLEEALRTFMGAVGRGSAGFGSIFDDLPWYLKPIKWIVYGVYWAYEQWEEIKEKLSCGHK